jgi:hypothetical protein
MFYQINFEKRSELIQDVIDRLTRLNAEQSAKYLHELESLHKKYHIKWEKDEVGARHYPVNKNLRK